MIETENIIIEIKAGKITFIVTAHFKESSNETVDKKLKKLIEQEMKNRMTKTNFS